MISKHCCKNDEWDRQRERESSKKKKKKTNMSRDSLLNGV